MSVNTHKNLSSISHQPHLFYIFSFIYHYFGTKEVVKNYNLAPPESVKISNNAKRLVCAQKISF